MAIPSRDYWFNNDTHPTRPDFPLEYVDILPGRYRREMLASTIPISQSVACALSGNNSLLRTMILESPARIGNLVIPRLPSPMYSGSLRNFMEERNTSAFDKAFNLSGQTTILELTCPGDSALLDERYASSYSKFDRALENDKNVRNVRGLAEFRQLVFMSFMVIETKPMTFVVQNPTEIHLENELLSNEKGPAAVWKDGFKCWAIRGIRLNETIVMHPERQTVDEILAERNNDVRAIRIERFGWPRFLKESKASPIDVRRNEVEGTWEALYQFGAANWNSQTRLVVTCPTKRMFALRVPNEIRACEQAQKWLWPVKCNIIART